MIDPLIWAPINLGRWFGTRVRLHLFLIVFLLSELLNALIAQEPRFLSTLAVLSLLLVALAIHELAHALAATWSGDEPPDEIQLWPLGNMVVEPAVSQRSAHFAALVAGPVANGLIAVSIALMLACFNAQFVWNPFGNPHDAGAPILGATHARAVTFHPIWWLGWFGYLNYLLMVINLIPALPFDGGRIFRWFLARSSLGHSKDGYYGLWTAHTSAAVLVLVGVIRLVSGNPEDGVLLIVLAIPIELIVRSEARQLDEVGYFEDGVFGYDFSEGYTSLEANAAKVRPHRDSAMERWRRRRSELRRERLQAKEAAEEQRMDEILEKLYSQGRNALSDEENRFLVRVSARIRSRLKAHD